MMTRGHLLEGIPAKNTTPCEADREKSNLATNNFIKLPAIITLSREIIWDQLSSQMKHASWRKINNKAQIQPFEFNGTIYLA